ncbi:MAG: 4Fe-4S dicluster domain-containing protein [Pseudomonadales bacterium]|jgi:ferredoxin|nr:4Fe-4S dicluster domain-containing protein [Pseudomonadales bacterium]
MSAQPRGTDLLLPFADVDRLLEALRDQGYRPIGPRIEGGAISLGALEDARDLPWGLRDTQEAGRYRLAPGDAGAFGHNATANSWKSVLHPSRRTLFSCGADLIAREGAVDTGPFAFIGVRACDLAALRIQDRVRNGSDAAYSQTRASALLVAVQCRTAAATCFCPSMGTGPALPAGADLELVEEPAQRAFRLCAHSDRGAAVVAVLELDAAEGDGAAVRREQIRAAAAEIDRHLDSATLPARILEAQESPVWDAVAERCLACGNCTSACPTCFCTRSEDQVDVAGTTATRTETWDSCFHLDFTYIHDTHERTSTRARYRQWATHKFATWHAQFGSSGCVGCGRCITWCPVGIDVTAVLADLGEADP